MLAEYFEDEDSSSDEDDDEEEDEGGEGDGGDGKRARRIAPPARLLVESSDGEWGEVRSLSALRAALAESLHDHDRNLLAELNQRQEERCAPHAPLATHAPEWP